MIDLIETDTHVYYYTPEGDFVDVFSNGTFTRSNGTLFSRIYERLTKRSRRWSDMDERWGWSPQDLYREGLKDGLEALRAELS